MALSLEGKANQLGQMVREHLPMAMQGLVVVPLFAGLRPAPRRGADLHLRRHRRALRGDRLTRPRVGGSRRPHHDQARLARPTSAATRRSSWRSGPCTRRPTRTPPPVVPTSCGASSPWWRRSPPTGYERLRRRRGGRSASPRSSSGAASGAARGWRLMTMPFYVAPEQVMKDRAEYAQKGIARGRSLVAVRLRRRHPDRGREPVALAAQGERDLRPDRLRRRGQVQRVRPAARGRGPPRRHQGLRLQPRGRRRPLARQPLRPVSWARSSPTR